MNDRAATTAVGIPGPWWRWPLVLVLIVATLTCVTAYGIWYSTTDLDTVANDFAIPLARLVDVLLALNCLFWMVPGLVVLRRANWHPVGWMLLAAGLGYALAFDMGEADVWGMLRIPDHWAAWVADGWGNSVSFTSTAVLLTVFPDGLPREPRARRWSWILISVALVGLASSGLGTTVGGHGEATFAAREFTNPTGLGFLPPGVAAWMFLLTLLSMVGAAVALWRRSRRASEAQRGQYMWVLFPFAVLIGSVVVTIPLSYVLGDSLWLGVAMLYFFVPIAFSIAIVRQRLFDIDRIVSRTVLYAVVGLVVAAVYVIPVVLLPEVLGASSDLVVALATLTAAAVFNPLRRRVQAVVDRRFDRERYDAERLVAGLSGRLQAASDLNRVTEELGRVVDAALHPSMVSVWFGAQSR